MINVTTARAENVSDFNTGWKGFKQYLIVDRYLGAASNGLIYPCCDVPKT